MKMMYYSDMTGVLDGTTDAGGGGDDTDVGNDPGDDVGMKVIVVEGTGMH